jgi:hypothetical protein
MMMAYASGFQGNSVDKANEALRYVRLLVEQGARFFVDNPIAAKHLERISSADLRYIAHEYLAPHNEACYFSQVSGRMRDAGLTFAGSLFPGQNYLAASVPEQFHQLMRTAPNRAVLETHRDFITNNSFRLDLYAAQSIQPPLAVISKPAIERFPFRVRQGAGPLPLNGEAFNVRYDFAASATRVRRIHDLLRRAPSSPKAMANALGDATEDSVLDLVQVMVLADHLLPCAPPAKRVDCGRLQSELLREARSLGQQHVLQLFADEGGAEYVPLAGT